jgi:hypothetical protein
MTVKRLQAGMAGLVALCAAFGLLATVSHSHGGLGEWPTSPAFDSDPPQASAPGDCPACALARTALATAGADHGPGAPCRVGDPLRADGPILPENPATTSGVCRAPPARV